MNSIDPKAVLIGKRYTNHVGRVFVRVAIPEDNDQAWTMDLCVRSGRNSVEHISGAREIRAAAIEHHDAGFGSTHPRHTLSRDFPKHFAYDTSS